VAGRLAGAVLLVDGYEQLGPIDGWLRQAFLPALPADALVVLAGRDAPASPWRTDPGWRSLVAVRRLDHFDEAESDELLALAGVAPPVRAHLVRLGRGHPLAMALLADVAVTGTVPDSLAEVPDLVSALLETLLRGAPSDAHMSGLAACATAWLTTEDLLRKVVGADAPAVWGLAGTAAVHRQRAPRALAPRPGQGRAGRRVRAPLAGAVPVAAPGRPRPRGRRPARRHRPRPPAPGPAPALPAPSEPPDPRLLRAAGPGLGGGGPGPPRRARPGPLDPGGLRGRGHGPAGRGVAGRAARHPQRGPRPPGVAAYAYHVLHPTGSALEDRDPVTRAALAHVARHGPARPGEQVDVARFEVDVGGETRVAYGNDWRPPRPGGD
jgi:hypothetical protein